jgi:hypothetical protein
MKLKEKLFIIIPTIIIAGIVIITLVTYPGNLMYL